MKNVIFCDMSYPDLREDIKANQSALYYRLHGRRQLYASPYKTPEIQQATEEIMMKGIVDKAYIYFTRTLVDRL